MGLISYDEVVAAADNAGLEESAVRHNYSGRAMYGKECLGLVYDNLDELLMFYGHLLLMTDLTDQLVGTRTDNMGRSMIAYWPSVQVNEVPDEVTGYTQ